MLARPERVPLPKQQTRCKFRLSGTNEGDWRRAKICPKNLGLLTLIGRKTYDFPGWCVLALGRRYPVFAQLTHTAKLTQCVSLTANEEETGNTGCDLRSAVSVHELTARSLGEWWSSRPASAYNGQVHAFYEALRGTWGDFSVNTHTERDVNAVWFVFKGPGEMSSTREGEGCLRSDWWDRWLSVLVGATGQEGESESNNANRTLKIESFRCLTEFQFQWGSTSVWKKKGVLEVQEKDKDVVSVSKDPGVSLKS